jgi:peptide chain release factor 2
MRKASPDSRKNEPCLPNTSKTFRTFANASLRCEGIFDLDSLETSVNELDGISQEDGFWNDANRARAQLKERARLKETIDSFQKPWSRFEDLEVLLELSAEEGQDEEFEAEIETETQALMAEVESLEFRRMMGNEEDASSAILAINSGAGGTESQDWAEMLLRMYLRYAEKNGFKARLLDRLDGEEAGLKSATITLEGNYAFGYLKAEAGVHRLVRISPFDSQKRRHTSFASVYVYPDIEDEIEIDIQDKDLRLDTFRASGAGGQHVNRTDSAVRLTHLPSGIVVSCQNERSQHKNRATAMKILKARLYDREVQARNEAKAELEAGKQAIDFGSQIRSYVLHPYRMVKDHRTNFEVGNADAVLDGDLQGLIKAYLMFSSD